MRLTRKDFARGGSMRKIWFRSIASLVLCLMGLAGSRARAQGFPVQTKMLKNGMKVLVQSDHSIPNVALYIFDSEADRIASLGFDPQTIQSERGGVASEPRPPTDNDNGGLLDEPLWATA